ncbi:MAG: hypothetical protein GEV10_29285 [Streptosporangiales bacterium]|nr:hypothetical protein [Streptosporangiales bacterium]
MTARKVGRVALIVLGSVIAIYFIVRAVVELFVVDFGDPSSYSDAWGGPSLAGVLAVHCGPGLISSVVMGYLLTRRARRSRRRQTPRTPR